MKNFLILLLIIFGIVSFVIVKLVNDTNNPIMKEHLNRKAVCRELFKEIEFEGDIVEVKQKGHSACVMKFSVDSLKGRVGDCMFYDNGFLSLELSISSMYSTPEGWKIQGRGKVIKKKGDYFVKAKAQNHKVLNFEMF